VAGRVGCAGALGNVTGGLAGRMAVASGLLAVVVGTAFAVLLPSVAELRRAQDQAGQSEQVLVVANQLERLVVDLETGQRGFLLTGKEEFLQPWSAAQASLPGVAATLEQLVAGNPEQQARAARITEAGRSYLRDYSAPLIAAARRDPASVRTVPATEEGKRRVDAIRVEFDRLIATEQNLALTRQQHSETSAHRAIAAAVGGLAGSVLLIAGFAGYLTSAIVGPLRRAAAAAGRLAGGDLDTRLSTRGVAEIGVLERSFNAMASSLEDSREQLAASRARLVTAADQARQRIERDLHDGTQQRLVSIALHVRAAEAELPPELPEVRTQLARIANGLTGAVDDLREIARGIHPAILSEGGLVPALKALARRSAVPVQLDLDVPTRLPEPVEVAAYYVVSEALANAAKHAHASTAHVDARARDGSLHLSVRDDGVGGATPKRGSGLVGLTDRVEALGGTISLDSAPAQGTVLRVELPLPTGPLGDVPAVPVSPIEPTA
jgi:signal transduction histidine kinase